MDVTQCDTCEKIFSTLAEVKEHRETYHKEALSYNCKLCSERFKPEELLIKHRTCERHQMLSKSVDEQFIMQIGKFCEE